MTERILSCSDCAALACKAKEENKYPKFCVTAKLDENIKNAARARADDNHVVIHHKSLRKGKIGIKKVNDRL